MIRFENTGSSATPAREKRQWCGRAWQGQGQRYRSVVITPAVTTAPDHVVRVHPFRTNQKPPAAKTTLRVGYDAPGASLSMEGPALGWTDGLKITLSSRNDTDGIGPGVSFQGRSVRSTGLIAGPPAATRPRNLDPQSAGFRNCPRPTKKRGAPTPPGAGPGLGDHEATRRKPGRRDVDWPGACPTLLGAPIPGCAPQEPGLLRHPRINGKWPGLESLTRAFHGTHVLAERKRASTRDHRGRGTLGLQSPADRTWSDCCRC